MGRMGHMGLCWFFFRGRSLDSAGLGFYFVVRIVWESYVVEDKLVSSKRKSFPLVLIFLYFVKLSSIIRDC